MEAVAHVIAPMPTHELTSIELFTGAGGLALATHKAGFHHVGLVEWNRDACSTLRENVAARAIHGIESWQILESDVRAVHFRDFGKVDLVAGGPPCQPFSIGGNHRGMNDERNMFPEFIRAVRALAPKVFIIENVKGLTRQAFHNYFESIVLQLTYPEMEPKRRESEAAHLDRLEETRTRGYYTGLQYNVVHRTLNAANYGVPQTRERVFIVGFRSDLKCEWHFPELTHSFDALLYEQWMTGEYWERHGVNKPRNTNDRLRARVAKLHGALLPMGTKPWRTIRDAIADLPEPLPQRDVNQIPNHQLQLGARLYPGHTGSLIDLPSKTLKAGDHGVPGGENTVVFPDGRVRYLTVRESARIQTFPDTWRFRGSWTEAMRQLGNAVPVTLAQVVAESVAERLRRFHD